MLLAIVSFYSIITFEFKIILYFRGQETGAEIDNCRTNQTCLVCRLWVCQYLLLIGESNSEAMDRLVHIDFKSGQADVA